MPYLSGLKLNHNLSKYVFIPNFSFWIPISLTKIYFSRVVLNHGNIRTLVLYEAPSLENLEQSCGALNACARQKEGRGTNVALKFVGPQTKFLNNDVQNYSL